LRWPEAECGAISRMFFRIDEVVGRLHHDDTHSQ
jgi:hypothetical protein